jgi:dUTP pyrophosphatase
MSSNNTLNIQLNHPNAKKPYKATNNSAGFDLYSTERILLKKHSQQVISTGIIVEIPNNCYGQIAPRSGLALKYSIDVLAGVIDSDYRGEIKVILYNHSDTDYEININERIAQLILIKYCHNINTVNITELSNTNRGNNGFGSSGKM